ncbi:MAG: hypothetical protein GY845_35455 [Planctomycetes bacterium]|nr:hypothetical protein [Planctomycetota bacterium]
MSTTEEIRHIEETKAAIEDKQEVEDLLLSTSTKKREEVADIGFNSLPPKVEDMKSTPPTSSKKSSLSRIPLTHSSQQQDFYKRKYESKKQQYRDEKGRWQRKLEYQRNRSQTKNEKIQKQVKEERKRQQTKKKPVTATSEETFDTSVPRAGKHKTLPISNPAEEMHDGYFTDYAWGDIASKALPITAASLGIAAAFFL